MKQIEFDGNFSDNVYDLKNKFSFIKELLIKVVSFITTLPILYFVFLNTGILLDSLIIYDFIFYYFILMIPLDIYNMKKTKRKIIEKNEEASKKLNKLIYKLQKENVYINIDSLKKSIKKETIDENNNIITRFYLLDRENQIKVLEEIKKMSLFKNKGSSLFLLDENDISEDELNKVKKINRKR